MHRGTPAAVALGLLVAAPRAAAGQELSRLGFDSVVSIDQFAGENASSRPNIIVDVSAVVRIGGGWRAYVRPWFRQPRSPEWDKQIYQAVLQYERPGRIGTRLDLGYLASPIGLGMMDTRPGVNPTISAHSMYFAPLPAFEPGAPRVQPLASSYPLGGQLTLSTARWDMRGALVSSAPTRMYVINRVGNPRPTPVVEGGVGFSPAAGIRVGAALAHGAWATRDELPAPAHGDLRVTVAALEGELAVNDTKVSAELARSAFDTGRGAVQAYVWFVQGMQTLTPRVFLAARQEGASAPPATSGPTLGVRSSARTTEATVGYRLSTDFTARTSLMLRRPFTRSESDRQIGISLVWARRWW
jgi:hypothetical protein